MKKLNNQCLKMAESAGKAKGEVEIIIQDRHGNVIQHQKENNLVKIFAKEMLAHRLPFSKVWDDSGSAGTGAWVDSEIDVDEEFAAKYILLGASFDTDGNPLGTADTRFYTYDSITNSYIAKTPNVGADNDGGLINPIPLADPYRSLKKIQNIYFEPSYQPSDTPLLSEDVRAMGNVLVVETILKTDEYNGFNRYDGDYFTITEVALAGGKTLTTVGSTCECAPNTLFLEGVDGAIDAPIAAIANASQTISLDPSVSISDVNRIKTGDQIKIVGDGSDDTLGQINQYYLVTYKAVGGRDIVLDRTPTDSSGTPLTGDIGVYRSSLRIFSHRILSTPCKKSKDYQITIRWYITFA